MAHAVNFTTPNNKINIKSVLDYTWYLLITIQMYLLALPCMILTTILSLCVGRLMRRNEEISCLKYMRCLLSSNVCQGNFATFGSDCEENATYFDVR